MLLIMLGAESRLILSIRKSPVNDPAKIMNSGS